MFMYNSYQQMAANGSGFSQHTLQSGLSKVLKRLLNSETTVYDNILILHCGNCKKTKNVVPFSSVCCSHIEMLLFMSKCLNKFH